MRKKLLIAVDTFLPRRDGITRFLTELLPELTKTYDVTVACPHFEGNGHDPQDVTVERFDLINIRFGDIYFAKPNYKRIKELVSQCDIVYSHTIGPIGFLAVRAAHKLKKPIITQVHSIEWELTTKSLDKFKLVTNWFTRTIARNHYNKSDLLIVPSIEARVKYRKNRIRTKSKIVSLGCDTKKFACTEARDTAKEKLGINKDMFVVGYHGRLGREKNLVTLFRAFKGLQKKMSNVKLLIVGGGFPEMEHRFKEDKNVILTGIQEDVVPYLQAMDIYVLPSLTETSSLSTMEAMSCCLPVITTPVGYVKDYIKEKENGMFFPFRNSIVLTLKMELLLKDRGLREKLGKNARRTIEDTFSWEKTIVGVKEALSLF